MFPKLTRRKFLKGTGVSAAALSLNLDGLSPAQARMADPVPTTQEQFIPTICALCPARCHLLARVRDGKLLGITGNDRSPYNGASVCGRALAAKKLVYDPDRLRYPMKRTGSRGEGKWARIGWDEAIDTVSSQLEKALHNSGPQAIALFGKGPSARYIRELFQEFYIPHLNDSAAEHCHTARDLAYRLTFGRSPGYPDYENTRCIVLFGCHLGENVMVPELQRLAAALSRGASLIVIDPRFSAIAAKADHYLQIRPGTDSALILGWINFLVEAGHYDIAHMESRVEGFADLTGIAGGYSPEVVSRITGIPGELIIQTAQTIAGHAPRVIIHPGRHSSWYGNDFERLRAQAVLTGFLRSWDAKGGIYPAKPLGKDVESASFADNFQWIAETLKVAGDKSSTIIKNIIAGRIKVVGCWGQNPFHAYPNPYRTAEAFKKAEFTFACDILPSEPALYADIILPEATFLERWDGVSPASQCSPPCLGLARPVIAPQFESRDPYWIVKRLSNRLGRGDGFIFQTAEERVEHELLRYGVTLKDFSRQSGVVRLPESSDDRTDSRPVFPTPSGKMEFRSQFLVRQGHAAVPDFTPVPQPGPGFFRLLYGQSPVRSHTTTANDPWLGHEMAENELWINEQEAFRLGFSHGERVLLENQDGVWSPSPVRLKLTPGIRRDCVYTVHGFGSRSPLLHFGYDRGVADSSLMTRSLPDPVSGCRGLRVNFVRPVKKG